MPISRPVRRLAFDALHFSGTNRLLQPVFAGRGVALMLHRVRPARPGAFQPNSFLEITPDFLEQSIRWLMRRSYEFVSLEEGSRRLLEREVKPRCAIVTFDDGFHDVAEWAGPILEKYRIPYTIFVTTSFADGTGCLWWLALEHIVGTHEEIVVDDRPIPCRTVREKDLAFAALRTMVLTRKTQAEEIAFVRRLAQKYGYDLELATRSVCMNWQDLRRLAANPLVTIGSHTVSHPFLSKMGNEDVRAELTQSRQCLEDKFQKHVRSLAYPYGSADVVGDREFRMAAQTGYSIAFTTRSGVLARADGKRLLELPRVAVDGRYQKQRYLDVFVSGVASAAWQQVKRAAPQVGERRTSTSRETQCA